MAINFDSLPTENPFAIMDGIYKAKIIESTMKKGKDTAKPPYLNLKYELKNAEGKKVGNIYDIIAESDSQVVQYKVGRFLRACNIPLHGSMELSDIAKLVLNRDLVVDVKTTPDDGARPQVDLFGREGYYTPEEFAEIYAIANPEAVPVPSMNIPEGVDEEVPFNAEPEAPTAPAATPAPATEAEY